MNIQSLRTKFDELQCGIDCDILVLVETWLYTSETPLYNIKGYNAVHSCRDSRGGGAVIYIRSMIKYREINCSIGKKYNWICVNIDNSLNLSAIYRPPLYKVNDFLQEFEIILHNRRDNHIVIGDININLLDNSDIVREYKNLIALNGFAIINKIEVGQATRVTDTTATLIDHVVCSSALRDRCRVKVENSALTDHRELNLEVKKKVQTYKKKITYEKCILNSEKFKNDFENNLRNTDVNSFEELINIINKSKKASQKIIKINCREGNEWITQELLNLIKEKNQAFKKYKNNPNISENFDTFKKLKNNVTNKIKTLKNRHFKNKWERAGHDARKQWKVINSFICGNSKEGSIKELEVNGNPMTKTQDIITILNSYFAQIGTGIVKDIEAEKNKINSNMTFPQVHSSNSLFLETTNENEIEKILHNLKRDTAAGSDNILVKDLLTLKNIVVKVIVKLVNNVLETGVFPKELKIAKICPIYKTGAKNMMNNYRPISLISIFSKIVESVVKSRMLSFVSKYVRHDPFQYGFLENSSTLSATVDLLNYISANLDEGMIVVSVFIDLRKAFDVVSHDLLLKKLRLMGFRGVILQLLETYLRDREQYIEINNEKSPVMKNNCGVPQGSVLGPLLYSLFVLSLRLAGLKGQYYTFADDTVIVYAGGDEKKLVDLINCDLGRYYNWLLNNKLKLNIDKTKYMLLKQKNKIVNNITISINGTELQKVDSFKYLGLVIDENLTWVDHIEHIKNKLISFIGAIYRCRHFLTKNTKYKIYNAYFLSVMRYLIPVWGTCSESNFQKTIVLQKKY